MKRPLSVALGLATLLSTQAFACDADHTAAMISQLSKSNLQSNVQAASLNRKAAYCEQNAKNLALQGNEKANYVAGCVNKNEAREHHAAINGRV